MRQIVTSSIVTAASTYDLTTLDAVKAQLNISSGDTTYDAWISQAISNGSAAIETYCNRTFVQETVKDVIWLQNDDYPYQVPGRVAPLQLSRYPVTSVTSCIVTEGVNVLNTLTAGTDFILDSNAGQLIRLNTWTNFPTNWDSAPTTVQFVAGYTTIPLDIVEGLFRWIASAYQARQRDPNLKEWEQPGLGRKVFWVPSGPPTSHFPPDIADLLDSYRVPVVQ